jgi:hypothetical protein
VIVSLIPVVYSTHTILRRCDAFPLVTFLLRRHESAIDLQHEDGVGMPELARNQFRWRTGAGRTDSVGVALIVDPIILDPRAAHAALW